jgi:hypothetical protein
MLYSIHKSYYYSGVIVILQRKFSPLAEGKMTKNGFYSASGLPAIILKIHDPILDIPLSSIDIDDDSFLTLKKGETKIVSFCENLQYRWMLFLDLLSELENDDSGPIPVKMLFCQRNESASLHFCPSFLPSVSANHGLIR